MIEGHSYRIWKKELDVDGYIEMENERRNEKE